MAITYDAVNNQILGDGFSEVTPMDYDDFVTADRAGSYEILAAIAPALNLTLDKAIRPVESLALLITFTLAGTNAGAGDTLDVTGTDAWGDALSENLDVSAGNGDHITTERFATITDIDCTGFNDGVGTVSATQPQWGVVWEKRGESQGMFDCPVRFGDAASGYCAFEKIQICLNATVGSTYLYVKDGQLRFGRMKNETNKATENHAQVLTYHDGNINACPFGGGYDGQILAYGISATRNGGGGVSQIGLRETANGNRIWNSTFCDKIYFYNVNGDFFNVTMCDTYYTFRIPGDTTFKKITVLNASRVCGFGGNSNNILIDQLYARGCSKLCVIEHPWYDPCNFYFLDADVDTWLATTYQSTYMYIHRQYRCDLHIVDEDGNDWTSKTVEMKDNDDDETFSVSTDGSGEIAQQKVDYIVYGLGAASDEDEFPHVINLYDGATLVHTLTGLIIDGPMKRRIEIPASYPTEADVESGVDYGAGLTGDLVVPAEAQVLDGVGFGGGSGSEHAGTVTLPVEADVEDGVTYGPGGSGLTGTVTLPVEADVKTDKTYGAGGNEFTGALIVPQSPLAIAVDIDGPLDVAVDLDGPLEIAVALGDLDVAVEISELSVAVEISDLDVAVEVA